MLHTLFNFGLIVLTIALSSALAVMLITLAFIGIWMCVEIIKDLF